MGAEKGLMFKVTIRDPEAFRSLDPEIVAEYLRNKGWTRVEVIGDMGAVWALSPKRGQQFEILLPARKDIGDYILRMSQALEVLEAAEQRVAPQ
jgi:hypothetical protein